jgi:hypothetical protein
MIKHRTWWILVLVTLTMPAMAQDDDSPWVGRVEVGYRSVDVNGNVDKYREDVNLPDNALRLFDLGLEWEPSETGWLDRMQLEAQGIGGEPFASARFGLEKDGRYKLDIRWRSVAFFYRDFGFWYLPQGDIHTWDANRKFLDLKFNYRFTKWFNLRLGSGHITRDGGSTTSRDVQREVFVLDRPLAQETRTYWLGADFRAGWADITVEQRLYDFDDERTMTTRDSEGVGMGPDASYLAQYDQHRTERTEAPTTRLGVRGRPLDWLRFDLRYARIDARSDYTMDGEWGGLDFDANPFQTQVTNAGEVERISDLWDLDLGFALTRNVELLVDYSSRSFDQRGTIDYQETQTGGTEAGQFIVQGAVNNEINLDAAGVTVDWRATRSFSVALGVGLQERSKLFQLSGPEVTTERTTYRGQLRWRPNKTWNLKLDYEQGDTDNPVTQISPTTTDRLRFQADVRALKNLQVGFNWIDRSASNELTYPLGIPTDDTPPVDSISTAKFDFRSWALFVNWTLQRMKLFVSYTNSTIDSVADIVYITGGTFFPPDITTTQNTTDYHSNQDVVQADFSYRIGRPWTVGLKTIWYQNDGRFPNPETVPATPTYASIDIDPAVDSTYYRLYGLYAFDSGVFVRLYYDRYDYQENTPFAIDAADPVLDVSDYDAKLWTLSAGYTF